MTTATSSKGSSNILSAAHLLKRSRKTLGAPAQLALMKVVKGGIHGLLRRFGYDIVSVQRPQRPRPTISGASTITGSFPPYAEYSSIGRPENYFIHDSYQARQRAAYFDDSAQSDEWQDEVYRFAHEIADDYSVDTVCDIGCGSGYKLLKYFLNRRTLGLDVEPTYEKLKQQYPDRCWMICDFRTLPAMPVDLVIASDVIEHLADPDALLLYLKSLKPQWIVLSTPDRNLLRDGTHNGPPTNPAHVREWNMAEFHAYIGEYFDIVEHFISNASQSTQCILACPK